ncbi:MAG TPA: glucoamylase family protein [Candidatus Aminicenantes bacterium]|nr:glucoamylase family protein [Candidatus Aminicenantes bacterium]HPS79063.1 glucoamylase family protein [Thermoanaerobaculaceae bacterium]
MRQADLTRPDPRPLSEEWESPRFLRQADRPWRRGWRTLVLAAALGATAFSPGLAQAPLPGSVPPSEAAPARAVRLPRQRLTAHRLSPLLLDIEQRTFRFFWETANPTNGLIPDRWPTPSFASVAAVGFGLAAYPVGVDHGWITREEATGRVLTTLRFFSNAPQGPEPAGRTGYRGFFYHFLDMQTGARFEHVELSTVDTAWFVAGALTCQMFFDGDSAAEREIRELADSIYRRVEWTWAQPRPPLVSMGWTPEDGQHNLDWRGYDESMMVYVLGLGSPTFPIAAEAWPTFCSSYQWRAYYGFEHVNFAPLFGHQYTQVFVDFRGIRDAYTRDKGIDYFENSRRATLAQRAYATDNPSGWKDYGANVWGLTACDGPLDVILDVNGIPRRFFTYAARGASGVEVRDDGTIAPWAALASMPFAPEVVVPAIEEMHRRWGEHIVGQYGFWDAFNPTFTFPGVTPHHGKIVPGVVWVDGDVLGIDQGPALLMLENYRSDLIWRLLRRHPAIVQGLRRAGFSGGWLGS